MKLFIFFDRDYNEYQVSVSDYGSIASYVFTTWPEVQSFLSTLTYPCPPTITSSATATSSPKPA
jgi:hypothetical protein